jgi:nicotinamide mononucleotide adenylyltransferase
VVLSQIRWVCMRSTLPSKFRYNVWKSWFVLIMKLDINFALVMLMSKGRSMSVYWSCCKVPESRSTGRFNFNGQRSHNSEYKFTAMVRQRNVRWFLLEKDWKLDRQRLASIDQCSFRTWWSDLRTKSMYDEVRGGSEWRRSVADKHWNSGEIRCCVHPLFRQKPSDADTAPSRRRNNSRAMRLKQAASSRTARQPGFQRKSLKGESPNNFF